MGLALLVLLTGCGERPAPPVAVSGAVPAVAPDYVGSESCAGCHADAYGSWAASHHAAAMLPPGAGSVRGNFATGHTAADGTHTQFSADDRYTLEVRSRSGEVEAFEVAYTFGTFPLQQYLIEFPDGRLQVLPLSADVRAGDGAAARWYHSYGDDPPAAGDPLHWRGYMQNWNEMCADCHSTNVKKGYDAATDTFATTWSEVTVGCEACHGPASAHVAWAAAPDEAPLRGFAAPVDELTVCGRCHSRRGQLQDGFMPGRELFDHYRPALLEPGLYHVDGQVLDEVFVYGSFLQSRMHQQGVTCGDCHAPHQAGVALDPVATCLRCHQEAPPARFPTLAAKRYDTPEHHFHDPGSTGAECVACHMPAKVFMGIDERHDHSFRVPRPDLTSSIGVPNTCNACHTERDAAWAEAAIRAHHPAPPDAHYGTVIAAARRGDGGAQMAATKLAADDTLPAIVRATAMALLESGPLQDAVIDAALQSEEPLLRLGALNGLDRAPADRRWWRGATLLDDPLLVVRHRAVEVLAPALRLGLAPAHGARLRRAIDAYAQTAARNADRPDAHLNLAIVHVSAGDAEAARAALHAALSLDAHFVPALLNLADLNRATGRDAQSDELFERALIREPESADVHLARGLWFVRQGDPAAAETALAAAAQLAPERPRFGYMYAVLLFSNGNGSAALAVLQDNLQRFPAHVDTLVALATMNRDAGRIADALPFAERLVEAAPERAEFAQLLMELRERAESE